MKELFLPFLFSLISLSLTAQQQSYSENEKKAIVNMYSELLVYPQEKIYVQTDRPYYITGETIWFRIFVLHASMLTPITFSRYVYVELVSPADTVMLRSKIRADSLKMFYGALKLPESIPEGKYRIRCYTRYMENMGEKFFYTRPVYIADSNPAKIAPHQEGIGHCR
jgi:uncharacterized protein YfaS (alpha-2-macroglobulin family)